MRLLATLGAGIVLVLGGALAHADELVLKNGNTLTGKVKESDGNTLTFDSQLSGIIKVKLENIRSVSTDGPVRIKLIDGTRVEENLIPAGDGQANIAGQATPLSSIKSIRVGKAEWNGDITLGAAFTRGNSYTDSINFSANAQRRTDFDRSTLTAGYLYGRQKDKSTGESSTTAENWHVAGKYDYFFNDELYIYGAGRFERDHIADLDYRITPNAGLGFQWIESADLSFNTEIGIGYLYEKYDPVPPGGESDNGEVTLRGAYHLTGKFSEQISFFHNLEIFPSVEDISSVFLTSDIGLRVALNKSLFAQFKFQVDWDSTPAASAEEFNLFYIVGMGWTF